MASSSNNLEDPSTGTKANFIPPRYTLGYLILVVIVTLLTCFVILSGNYSTWQADGQKIIDEKQWYRIFTGPFAVASFLDLSFLLISFLWLLFTLTKYEAKHSTLYVIYHFWKSNICIALAVAAMYWIMFQLTGMKNFIMNVGGIYPYALHLYLKGCLAAPSRTTSHWFLPCPVSRWVMGSLVVFLSVFLAPESQGCLVVFLSYLMNSLLVLFRHITGCRFFYVEGPWCYCFFRVLERVCPGFVTRHYGYCSVKDAQQIQNSQKMQQEKANQLAEEPSSEIAE